jgi:hypothetical protein
MSGFIDQGELRVNYRGFSKKSKKQDLTLSNQIGLFAVFGYDNHIAKRAHAKKHIYESEWSSISLGKNGRPLIPKYNFHRKKYGKENNYEKTPNISHQLFSHPSSHILHSTSTRAR